MDAMRTCLRFSLAAAVGAMVPILLVGCGMGEDGTSSSAPEPTASPTSSPQPTSASEELAGVPSGSILFLTGGGYSDNLYLVDAEGGEPKQLLDSAESDRPGGFSPDGKSIAYTSWLRDDGKPEGVYMMSRDGSHPQPVAGDGVSDWFISWSSQGRILYGEGVMGPADYWTINPDGSDRVRISRMNDCSQPADWSPDGKSLVLCQCASPPDIAPSCSLSVVDQQGIAIRTLLEDNSAIPHSPKWSPDGSHILFISQKRAGGPDTLVVMDADGTNAHDLYQSPADAGWTEAKWSSGGSQIAVVSSTQIVVVSLADGSTRIVAGGKNINYFAWSPNSDEIAYVSENDGTKLYVVRSDSGEPKVVADPVANTDVAWSPNGSQILFASNRQRQDGVWWASPDGSERGRLDALSREFVPPVEPTVEGVVGGCKKGPEDFSCLSPDGKSEAIALPNSKVLVIKDLASGATRDITANGVGFWNTPPVWSNHGTKIALYAYGSSKRALYVVDVTTGASTAIVEGAGSSGLDSTIAWSPDDSYVYYVKGTVCMEGCAPGFLYRVHPDGSGEQRVVDMRIGLVYGFKPTAEATGTSTGASIQHTGIAELDAIIDAFFTRDVDRLAGLAQYTTQSCAEQGSVASPPECPAGVKADTLVHVFPVYSCEGSYIWPDGMNEYLGNLVNDDQELFGVYRDHNGAPNDYEIILRTWTEPARPHPTVLSISDGRLVSIAYGCGQTAFDIANKSGPAVLPYVHVTEARHTSRRTGIEGVDAVIDAVESRDSRVLRHFIKFTPIACTTNKLGLGGPPLCRPDEAEGSVVDAFPIHSCEGHYLRPDETDRLPDSLTVEQLSLYAVYIPKAGWWPSADYVAIFSRPVPGVGFMAEEVFITDGWIVGTGDSCGVGIEVVVQDGQFDKVILPPP